MEAAHSLTVAANVIQEGRAKARPLASRYATQGETYG